MSLTVPSADDLALFEDTTVSDLGDLTIVGKYLQEATDLLEVATGWETMPTVARDIRIVRNGICAMAEHLMDAKGWRVLVSRPFISQTTGANSYSLLRDSAMTGVSGILWWDQAYQVLQALLNAGVDQPMSHSLHVFEDSEPVITGHDTDGHRTDWVRTTAEWPPGRYVRKFVAGPEDVPLPEP